MGGGSSTKAQSMQEQLRQQQQKQIKSVKYPPFSESEVQSLFKKFKVLDKSFKNCLQLEEFKLLSEIRMNFFRERIYMLIEQDIKQIKTMTFELFMEFLTVFHPLTDKEDKLNYMFRIYDYDGNKEITQDDLVSVFSLVYMKSIEINRKKIKNRPFTLQTNFMNTQYVVQLGKDIMNIADTDKSNSIDSDEFKSKISDSDIQFRMTIVF